ncbi:MAG: ATP-binding protein, partial [Haliea sp.]|nr:ATP-binding protein [Haliea sp.]
EDAVMQGDEAMLAVLLRTLLDNARKYTPVGGEISVFAGCRDGVPTLEVADTGPGIPPAERQHVFERFYRVTAQVREGVSGAGLGLAITQHIVQLHGAQVQLTDSHLGSGLAVVVRFPNAMGTR